MTTMTQAVTRSARTRSNFGSKARRFKNLLNDKKLLTRAHQQLCMSTRALFVAAYGDDELALEHYGVWERQTNAIARSKQINDRSTLTREEWDRIASDLLPLQVKAYAIVRLAC